MSVQCHSDGFCEVVESICPKRIPDARGQRNADEIRAGASGGFFAAGSFVDLVIENNMNEVFRPHASNRRERGHIHQQGSIAVQSYHLAIG
jgi:hypothetical protein